MSIFKSFHAFSQVHISQAKPSNEQTWTIKFCIINVFVSERKLEQKFQFTICKIISTKSNALEIQIYYK